MWWADDHAAFPFHVPGGEGMLQRMGLEQEAQGRDLLKVVDRDRRDLEAALAFGDAPGLRSEAVQDFPQRADAGAIGVAQPVEPQLLSRRKAAER